jgi:hypothetical protein
MQETIKRQENAIKANETVRTLYPHEKWEVLEVGIFIAKSRMPRSAEQINILEKELRQVEERYKEARVKTENIYLKIDAPLSRHEVTRKLSGYIQRKGYKGGVIFAYFSQSGEFYQWTETELAQKKSGSCDPAAIRGKSDIPKCPR